MSVNNLLYFDVAPLSNTQLSIHFHCPICGNDDYPNYSHRTWFNKVIAVPQQTNININAQFATIIPAHNDLATGLPCGGSGQAITLYGAIHKDATHPLACCISVNPIPANWWQQS